MKNSFNVFVFCLLQKQYLQILTINLQINFYHVNFIQWFSEKERSIDKMYTIKANNFESDIIRVRDLYF